MNHELHKLYHEARGLYRTDLTDAEAQDFWVKLVKWETINILTDANEEAMLNSTKYEFVWRMEFMGINYLSMDKLLAGMQEIINGEAAPNQIGRVQDVDDDL